MVSELQRVARGLVECLDEAPEVVAHLQRTAARCRENAGVVIDASHGEATVAALQLDAAARACEEAAHYLAMAPVQARGWAERLIGDFGRSSRASAASAKRNRATGGAGDLAERGEEPIEADLSGDRNDAAEPDQPDRRAGDDELTEVERRLVAKGNDRQAAELRYEPEEPVEAFEPIELPEIEVELAELTPQEDVPPPVPIEVEPFELPDGEGERPREEEQPSPVPIEVEPFELPDREGEQPRDETQPPPDAIDVEPVALPDEEDARPGEERFPLAPIGVEPIEVPEVEVVQPEPQDSPEPIEVEVWTDEVPGSDRHPRDER